MSRREELDVDDTLYVVTHSLGKADTFITLAEDLVEQSWRGGKDDDGDGDDSVMRRRKHVEYLIECAKEAVREAQYAHDQTVARLEGYRAESDRVAATTTATAKHRRRT